MARPTDARSARGVAALVAAMSGEAWEETRSAFVAWLEWQEGEDESAEVAARLDEHAAVIAGLDAVERDWRRLLILPQWRERLEGGIAGFVDTPQSRLPADGQAWAAAHGRERFPDGPEMAQALVTEAFEIYRRLARVDLATYGRELGPLFMKFTEYFSGARPRPSPGAPPVRIMAVARLLRQSTRHACADESSRSRRLAT